MKGRARALLIGGLGGALVGLLGAWLYLRNARRSRRCDPDLPDPAALIKLGLLIAGVLRHATALVGR